MLQRVVPLSHVCLSLCGCACSRIRDYNPSVAMTASAALVLPALTREKVTGEGMSRQVCAVYGGGEGFVRVRVELARLMQAPKLGRAAANAAAAATATAAAAAAAASAGTDDVDDAAATAGFALLAAAGGVDAPITSV